jgi:hypothetical protein
MTTTAEGIRNWSTFSADVRDFEQRRLLRFLDNMADAYDASGRTSKEATVRTALDVLRSADATLVTETLITELTELRDGFIAGHNREDAGTLRRAIHELRNLDQWATRVA